MLTFSPSYKSHLRSVSIALIVSSRSPACTILPSMTWISPGYIGNQFGRSGFETLPNCFADITHLNTFLLQTRSIHLPNQNIFCPQYFRGNFDPLTKEFEENLNYLVKKSNHHKGFSLSAVCSRPLILEEQ